MLGSSSFKEHIKEKFTALGSRVEIPESKALAPDADKVIATVCEHYNVTKETLLYSKRGTENAERDIAIYLVQLLCHAALPDVGKEFGINNHI